MMLLMLLFPSIVGNENADQFVCDPLYPFPFSCRPVMQPRPYGESEQWELLRKKSLFRPRRRLLLRFVDLLMMMLLIQTRDALTGYDDRHVSNWMNGSEGGGEGLNTAWANDRCVGIVIGRGSLHLVNNK